MTQILFNGIASDPVTLAERNLAFYGWFVTQYGCSLAHKDLWPGQTLREFIGRFISYADNNAESTIKEKAKRLRRRYGILYKKLTGTRLIIKRNVK